MNDSFEDALSKIKLIAGGLYGGHYEPKSNRDVDLAITLMKVHDKMHEKHSALRRGHVVQVIAGFNVGARGVVEFVEPSGQKVWVLRNGASNPVYYHPDELQKISLESL